MNDLLKDRLARLLAKPSTEFSLTKLTGDASYREYYRAAFDAGKSLIIMKMPEGFASISEEVTKASKKFNELPFVNIQKYLFGLGFPVPTLVADGSKEGILVLEDVGDKTLEQMVRQVPGELRLFFYNQAIDLLVRLQKATEGKPAANCLASYRRFDEDLLLWEFNHFLEFGIEDRLRIRLSEKDKRDLLEMGEMLVKEITKMSYGFTHRDFQSRNLMVHGYQLYLIDFQDALTGPTLYDLVALLRDSYVELGEGELRQLILSYLEKLEKEHPYFGKTEKCFRDFDLITIQRKLKDAGRFQYINTVKKNPSFLKSVPASLRYVREAFGRQTKYADLGRLIGKYLPEF